MFSKVFIINSQKIIVIPSFAVFIGLSYYFSSDVLYFTFPDEPPKVGDYFIVICRRGIFRVERWTPGVIHVYGRKIDYELTPIEYSFFVESGDVKTLGVMGVLR
jgi:hypothetical protein